MAQNFVVKRWSVQLAQENNKACNPAKANRFKQMISKATQHQVEKVQDLLTMMSGCASGLTDEDRSISPAPTLYVPSSGRVLAKRVSEVSVDSDGFPAFLADVGSRKDIRVTASSSSKGFKRKLAPADAMAMAAADEDLEDFENVIAEIDELAQLDEAEAKVFAASKATPSGAQASVVPVVRARRVSQSVSGRYTVMYYKQNNSFGVRQLFDKKRQIISICKRGQTKEMLQALADQAKIKLNSGKEEDDVKAWVQGKLDAM